MNLRPMLFAAIVSSMWVLPASAFSPNPITFAVKTFGAVGDGQTKDTKSLQAAIDAAFEAGGDSVPSIL